MCHLVVVTPDLSVRGVGADERDSIEQPLIRVRQIRIIDQIVQIYPFEGASGIERGRPGDEGVLVFPEAHGIPLDPVRSPFQGPPKAIAHENGRIVDYDVGEIDR